jgi:hypothetical protein
MFSEQASVQLATPFVTEQHLTADNYLNFLTNELPFSMEDVPLGTKRGNDGAPPHFGQVNR